MPTGASTILSYPPAQPRKAPGGVPQDDEPRQPSDKLVRLISGESDGTYRLVRFFFDSLANRLKQHVSGEHANFLSKSSEQCLMSMHTF